METETCTSLTARLARRLFEAWIGWELRCEVRLRLHVDSRGATGSGMAGKNV